MISSEQVLEKIQGDKDLIIQILKDFDFHNITDNGKENSTYIHFKFDDEKYLDIDGYVLNPQGCQKTNKELLELKAIHDVKYQTSSWGYYEGRVSKGGSYHTLEHCCYVFYRENSYDDWQETELGFRICRTL